MTRLSSRWRLPMHLPGFMPDAIPFALRTVVSLLLAYAVAFTAQIQAASTAGICVAIIAQPSAGMAFSKARYRLLGTLCGGVVGMLLLGLFPQDRTMLLIFYSLWLGACTYVGTLLRDFRSYGAVLSGYTAGIIAVAYIDAPQSGFVAALDRMAAILVGVACVLLVNTIFAGVGAFRGLREDLEAQTRTVTGWAADALDGRDLPDDMALLTTATAISALRTQATFAGTELPDGRLRSNGARHAIEALLGLITSSRTVSLALGPDTPAPWRAYLARVAESLRGGEPPGEPPPARDPVQALLRQGAEDALFQVAEVQTGLRALEGGTTGLPRIKVQVSHDRMGALIGAFRSIIAIGLVSVFTVAAGWGGATLLMIQSTAIIALLGTTPNPTRASLPFAYILAPVALLVGIVKFLVLPLASGFVPFALAIAPLVFVIALLVRHPRLTVYGTPSLLFATLLLSPSNPQGFDLGAYLNTVMELALATVFVLLTFRLILPVSPPRRLGRAAAEIGRAWCRGGDSRAVPPPSLLYDRLSRVLQWLGRPTRARLRLLSHLYAAAELDHSEREARRALAHAGPERPDLVTTAARSLPGHDPAAIMAAAQALLEGSGPGMRRAVASLAATALMLRRRPGLVRFGRHMAS